MTHGDASRPGRAATAAGAEARRLVERRWPLVGREAELERVRRLLRSDRGGAIVLAGPAGVGKTRLGAECLELAADRGFVPLRVSGTQSVGRLPLGAFAAFVPGLAADTDLPTVLRQVARSVLDRGAGAPVALLVDDAHLLDPASAALTHLLATGQDCCLLLTVRSGEPAPPPVIALWKDEVAPRLELTPFEPAEVGALLAAVLEGPVDGATLHRLWRRSEGNALFLREVVLGALETGRIRHEQGVWRLQGPLPPSFRLAEIVGARLGGPEHPHREALEVLAVGEPLELALLSAVGDRVDLEALRRRALVRIDRSGRRLEVRLHHPLYGEVLRDRLSPLRARAVARALAEALHGTGARRREDVLRLATWSLEGGTSVEADIMLRAATTARERHDFGLAERLARVAVGAGAGFEAGLLLGQACWLQGRAEEAERHLRGLEAEAVSDAQRALLASVRVNVLDFGLSRADLAVEVAEAAEATLSDPAQRDQLTADRARILARSGSYRSALALAEPLLDRADGAVLVTACCAAATSMAHGGRLAGAIATTERGYAAHLRLAGPPLPVGPAFHLMLRAGAMLLAGHLAEAAALAEREYRRGLEEGSVEAQAFFSDKLAEVALAEGRAGTAARLAGEAAAAFRELGWDLFVRCALATRAHALALLGEVRAARAVLADVDALDVPAGDLKGPEVLRARARVEVPPASRPAPVGICVMRWRWREPGVAGRSSPRRCTTSRGWAGRPRWPTACAS